ncbi:MAG: hypothetical protein K9J30_03885 [Bacteroidales bacterium]|nr:hypothetical protein [Bacteroidales bacterium]
MKTILIALACCIIAIDGFSQGGEASKSGDAEKDQVFMYSDSGFEPGKKYVITRHDGIEYRGEILSDDNREILMDTKSLGKIYIPKYQISTIYEIAEKTSIGYSSYQAEGPFTTRYSFTTNAHPIKKGENYGMLNVHGPEFHLAVSDHLNVGLMATWMASPLVLAGKYSFNTKEAKIHFSVGTLLGTSGYINNFRGYGGLHWANVTFGDRKSNITFSAGYAYLQTGTLHEYYAPGTYYTEQQFSDVGSERLQSIFQGPIVSIAGIGRIGAKASFVFDSMIGNFSYDKNNVESIYNDLNGTNTYVASDRRTNATALFLMPGVRFQSTPRKALQICVAGVSVFADESASFPIPMVSWFYQF